MMRTEAGEIYDRGGDDEKDLWLAGLDMFQAQYPENSTGWTVLELFRTHMGHGDYDEHG